MHTYKACKVDSQKRKQSSIEMIEPQQSTTKIDYKTVGAAVAGVSQ